MFLIPLRCLAGEELVYRNDPLGVEFTFPEDWIPLLMPQAKPVKTLCKDEKGRPTVKDSRKMMGTLVTLWEKDHSCSDGPGKAIHYRVEDVTRYRLSDCKDWLENLERHFKETRKSVRITGNAERRIVNREIWGKMTCLVVDEVKRDDEWVDRQTDMVVYVHMREWGERVLMHIFLAEYPDKASRYEVKDFEDIVGSCRFE